VPGLSEHVSNRSQVTKVGAEDVQRHFDDVIILRSIAVAWSAADNINAERHVTRGLLCGQ